MFGIIGCQDTSAAHNLSHVTMKTHVSHKQTLQFLKPLRKRVVEPWKQLQQICQILEKYLNMILMGPPSPISSPPSHPLSREYYNIKLHYCCCVRFLHFQVPGLSV